MKGIEIIKGLDWVLIVVALLLVAISLAMLFSSAPDNWVSSRFASQATALIISLPLAGLVVRVPYHSFKRYAVGLYLLAILGLVSVTLTGSVIRGTASRLEIAGFQIQPSEFMKISLIIMLSWALSRYKRIDWRALAMSGLFAGIPIAFILLEPDLGVAALLLMSWVGLLFYAGISWLYLSVLSIAGVLGAVASWIWLLADYQKDRLLVFIDPARDALGSGYNVMQSIVALGSGGWLGRGIGHGPQSRLQFLPEQHTDFIFASIGEELGLVGVLLVIALYAIMLWRILLIAKNTQDPFGQFLAVGSAIVLAASFTVSAGMNMGMLPVTGIPLPLLSYGGSNLLSTFLLLAIVQSVRVHSKWVQPPPTEISHLI